MLLLVGSPLGNAEVWAWSESGGWASDVTDTNGNYELNVAPGRWEIGFNPPVPADGSESPYLMEPPKSIKVGEGSKTLISLSAKQRLMLKVWFTVQLVHQSQI